MFGLLNEFRRYSTRKIGLCPSRSVLVARKRKNNLNPFYGIPAVIIAEWTGVSVGTAEHWKAGRRPPSRSALRLFRLYRDGKVLGNAWDGYKIVDKKLFCRDGRHVTEAHISHLALVCQRLADLDRPEYEKLLRLWPGGS